VFGSVGSVRQNFQFSEAFTTIKKVWGADWLWRLAVHIPCGRWKRCWVWHRERWTRAGDRDIRGTDHKAPHCEV